MVNANLNVVQEICFDTFEDKTTTNKQTVTGLRNVEFLKVNLVTDMVIEF